MKSWKVLPDIKTQGERVPLEEHIGRLIDAVVTLHATNQDLHRVLIDEVPLAPRNSMTLLSVSIIVAMKTSSVRRPRQTILKRTT